MANTLLEDAISYLTDNLKQAGESFKASNERDRALIQSYKSGGAVDPQQRQGMLEEYMGHANPMGAVGGMIKPSTWARYSPEAKTEMTQVANRFPQAFKEKVLDTPKDIYTRIDPNLPSSTGGQFHPGYPASSYMDMPAVIKLNPNQLGGSRRTLEHELIHNLNDVTGRVTNQAGNPNDAWSVARLLQSKIPSESRGSLDRVIERNTAPNSILNSKDPWNAAIERVTNAWDSRGMTPAPPTQSRLEGMLAMDEGLASLGQAAARPNASPEIRKLAKELGVSWEDKTREVLFGGKNSPKWNPRDVSMPPRSVPPVVDIKRDPVSQGALNAFNTLKQKLGLDATFGKFKGPTGTTGPEVLNEAKKQWDKSWQQLSEGGKNDVGRTSNDKLVSHVMDVIAEKLVKQPKDATSQPSIWRIPGGVSGMRKDLGGLFPYSGAKTGKEMPLNQFKALMQHLDKYGMLKMPENMQYGASKEGFQSSPLSRHIADMIKDTGGTGWKPEVLERLRRFIEETKD